MPFLFTALLVAAAMACSGGPSQPDRVPKEKPFVLKIGESALTTDDIRIRFDAVRSDSRCPSGAQCIWAGEATIAVTLSRYGEIPTGRELVLPGERASTTFQNFTITFTALAPYPGSGGGTSKEDYRATFVVNLR